VNHRPISTTILQAVVLAAAPAGAHMRILDQRTNHAHLQVHTMSAPADDTEKKGVAHTGMARDGYTELSPGAGRYAMSIEDRGDIRPPIMYDIMGLRDRIVPIDLTMRWVYSPDDVMWTRAAREWAQSFVAPGAAVTRISVRVASEPEQFVITIHEGAPDGPQIGRPRRFEAGSATWGYVDWVPGEVPTVAGVTYFVRIVAADGGEWVPFVHTTGDCYPEGSAYADRRCEPGTDLTMFIACEDDGYVQHRPGPGIDRTGWAMGSNRFPFVARGRNVIYARAEVRFDWPVDGPFTLNFLVRVVDGAGNPLGPTHRYWSSHHPPTPGAVKNHYSVGALWHPAQVPLKPGKMYWLECAVQEDLGEDGPPPRIDLQARLYGETVPGSHPSIFSQGLGAIGRNSIVVWWQKGNASSAIIEYGRQSGGVIESAAQESRAGGRATLRGLRADTTYAFRIVAESPAGFRYYSPWYLARTQAAYGSWGDVPRGHAYHPAFLPLADRPLEYPQPDRSPKVICPVPLVNGGFEQQMAHWTTLNGRVKASGRTDDIAPHAGDGMAGWTTLGEGNDLVDVMYQEVAVEPGHWYQLSAWVFTQSVYHGPEGLFHPRAQIRARLVFDPEAGDDFGHANSSQWYSTDGKWMRFGKVWRATGHRATVGIGFYQWHPFDRGIVYCDEVTLHEVEPPACLKSR